MLAALALGCAFAAFGLPILVALVLAARAFVEAAKHEDGDDLWAGLFFGFGGLMAGAAWLAILSDALS